MDKLYNFEEYVKECYEATIHFTVQEATWVGVFEGSYLTPTEKSWFKSFLSQNQIKSELLNESFIDKIHDVFQQSQQRGTKLAQKIGANTIKKLKNLSQSAQKFTDYLVGKMEELWSYALDRYGKNKKKQKAEIKEAILKNKEKLIKNKENLGTTLKKDVQEFKETINWWIQDFSKSLFEVAKEEINKLLIKESLTWKGEMVTELVEFNPEELNEGLRFGWLSKIAHSLAKIPPFSYLVEIREKATQEFGVFLANISDLTQKVGGPGTFAFTGLAIVLGAVSETIIKKISVGAAIVVVPLASTILGILGYVAYGLLVVEVLEDLLSAGEFLSQNLGITIEPGE